MLFFIIIFFLGFLSNLVSSLCPQVKVVFPSDRNNPKLFISIHLSKGEPKRLWAGGGRGVAGRPGWLQDIRRFKFPINTQQTGSHMTPV